MVHGLKVVLLNWRYSLVRLLPTALLLFIGFRYFWDCVFPSDRTAAISVPTSLVLLSVALFPDLIRGYLWPALLEIREEMAPHDAGWISTVKPEGKAFYYQLRVCNRGPATARIVSVYLEKIEKLLGTDRMPQGFVPLNLRWAYKLDSPFYSYIPADIERVCTLGHLPGDGHQTSNRTFHLDLEVEPTGDRHILRPGTYLLYLRALTDNGPPRRVKLRFELNADALPRAAEGSELLEIVKVSRC